jgi:hypothetical protein
VPHPRQAAFRYLHAAHEYENVTVFILVNLASRSSLVTHGSTLEFAWLALTFRVRWSGFKAGGATRCGGAGGPSCWAITRAVRGQRAGRVTDMRAACGSVSSSVGLGDLPERQRDSMGLVSPKPTTPPIHNTDRTSHPRATRSANRPSYLLLSHFFAIEPNPMKPATPTKTSGNSPPKITPAAISRKNLT